MSDRAKHLTGSSPARPLRSYSLSRPVSPVLRRLIEFTSLIPRVWIKTCVSDRGITRHWIKTNDGRPRAATRTDENRMAVGWAESSTRFGAGSPFQQLFSEERAVSDALSLSTTYLGATAWPSPHSPSLGS